MLKSIFTYVTLVFRVEEGGVTHLKIFNVVVLFSLERSTHYACNCAHYVVVFYFKSCFLTTHDISYSVNNVSALENREFSWKIIICQLIMNMINCYGSIK